MIIGFVFLCAKLFAFDKDSLKSKEVKVPKHYFNQTYYLDYYSTGTRTLDTTNTISKRLGTYDVSQRNFGFNIPLFTKDYYKNDSTTIANFHLLLTANYTKINLNFKGITNHKLVKNSIGLRGVYNNGKKGIFYFELAPFSTRDLKHEYTRTGRSAFTFLYNFTANEYFSFRAGYTRTYLWGNRYNVPYLGVRIGKIDKLNVSLQFPRSFSINFPIGRYIRTTIYTKPQGGLFAFANTDSIQVGDINDNKTLFFGRYEFLSGLRIDINPTKNVSFYLSGGITNRNVIAFSSAKTAPNYFSPYKNYYVEKIPSSGFLNFGIVLRFGKTKSIYNNYKMYDAIDINNSSIGGDNSVDAGNGNIPILPKKIKINNPDEVLDLIESQDLY